MVAGYPCCVSRISALMPEHIELQISVAIDNLWASVSRSVKNMNRLIYMLSNVQ